MRIVHPVAARKWIVRLGDGGEVLGRRRSPKQGRPVDLFAELVSFPELVMDPGLTIEVLLVHEDEIRTHDPSRAWRRRGWVVQEPRLLEVVDRVVVDSPADLAALLPDGLPAPFTTADLAAAIGRPRRLAQQMAYRLRRVGVLDAVGRTRGGVLHMATTPAPGRSPTAAG